MQSIFNYSKLIAYILSATVAGFQLEMPKSHVTELVTAIAGGLLVYLVPNSTTIKASSVNSTVPETPPVPADNGSAVQ